LWNDRSLAGKTTIILGGVTLGGFIGYLIWKLRQYYKNKKQAKEKEQQKLEIERLNELEQQIFSTAPQET
jgi:hypothetical protein